MNYKIPILFFIFVAVSFPQEKYFVFFKDKGIITPGLLQKTLDNFGEQTIERRRKALGISEMVTFEDIPVNSIYINLIKETGVTIINKLHWLNAFSAYLDDEQITRISAFPFVERVQRVKKLKEKFPDTQVLSQLYKQYNSSLFDLDYGQSLGQLLLSDIPIVHSIGITGKNVRIGLLDTGFDWKRHESLINSTVLAEYDFVFKDSVTSNQQGDVASQHDHGTAVLSVIGAYKPGKLIGAAFNSSFILAKTEDVRSELHIEEDNFVAALEWMESLGVDVISASLGYNEFDSGGSYTYADMNGKTTIVTKASEIAFNKGIVMINSAGNEGNKPWKYITAPADGFNVIAVGSVNNQNKVSGFSSLGPTSDGRIKPEILALGENVYVAQASTVNSYYYNGGTSFSAPVAAGVAALLLSAHPYLSNTEVRQILLATGDNSTSPNNSRGYGLSSALKAISFPVVKQIDFRNNIYKYIFAPLKDSVKLFFSISGYEFTVENTYIRDSAKFTFSIPAQDYGNNFFFYFTYRDSSNNVIRDPISENTFYRYYNEKTTIEGNRIEGSKEFNLLQNYPNPFNPGISATTFEIASLGSGYASLELFNVLGERVKTLYKGYLFPGLLQFKWDGKNESGKSLSPGVYIALMSVRGEMYNKKVILMK